MKLLNLFKRPRKVKVTFKDMLHAELVYEPIDCKLPSGYLLANYVKNTSK